MIRTQPVLRAISTRPARRRLARVTALGGGTGLPTVLAALRRHIPGDCRITAVVSAADNGGSSGVLRDRYNVLPPGDMRNCLVALAGESSKLGAALQFRFDGISDTAHPVGNLLLTALRQVTGDDLATMRLAATMLGVRDVVLPSTTARVQLTADLADGRSVRGEAQIPRSAARITRVRLDPDDVRTSPGVIEAILDADLIVLGPGSLYTSLIATVIVPGIAQALAASRAVRVLVTNLMTEPGETDGYALGAHLRALAAHGVRPDAFDYAIVNTAVIAPEVAARYAEAGARPLIVDDLRRKTRPIVLPGDFLETGHVVRHAADKLGPVLRWLGESRPHAGEVSGSWR